MRIRECRNRKDHRYVALSAVKEPEMHSDESPDSEGIAGRPPVSDPIITKWQRVTDLLAHVLKVPAALIMKVDPPEIEVFVSSSSEGNPYEPGERAALETGLYCEKVMAECAPLLVTDALNDPDWCDNPDIELGMTFYIGYPVMWPDGGVFGTICVLDVRNNPDAVEYREVLREFKEIVEGDLREKTNQENYLNDLQRINTELEGFSHTVSHELRGPLTAISLAAGLLQKLTRKPLTGDILEDIDEASEAISSNVDKSATLVEDLLSYAEAGTKPPRVEDVDVGTVVQTVIEERAGAIADRGIEVKAAADLGRVTANRTQMYQVFSNLIDNAIKHNDSESPRIEISYLGADEKDRHRYLVKDNGPGIPPHDLENIFVLFFKGESGETGVGLSIVEKIVKLYGGGIRAYNDNGACFELVIGNLEGSA